MKKSNHQNDLAYEHSSETFEISLRVERGHHSASIMAWLGGCVRWNHAATFCCSIVLWYEVKLTKKNKKYASFQFLIKGSTIQFKNQIFNNKSLKNLVLLCCLENGKKSLLKMGNTLLSKNISLYAKITIT